MEVSNSRSPSWFGIFGRLEWSLLLASVGLVLIGAAFIYSATSSRFSIEATSWFQERYVNQFLAAGLGLVLAVVISLIDYRIIARWSMALYWLAIGCLLLVFAMEPVAGVQRWIPLGVINFQPSEFAKLALILLLAHFLCRSGLDLRDPVVFVKALGLMLLPFALILIEPDLGSAVVLLPISFAMMFVAGIPRRNLLRVIGVGALLLGLTIVDILFAPENLQLIRLKDHQQYRLRVYFGFDGAGADATPEERRRAERDFRKWSYNVDQALISVGSGGLTGKGWRQGTQNVWGYLPRGVAHNDFIFSVIAEEKGFLGSLVVLVLYGIVIFGGIRVAVEARDPLGKVIAVGVATFWFSHIFINIGMNIKLMPVTGLPLPLLSDGGSSVLCFLLSIGLLENIYLHRRSY